MPAHSSDWGTQLEELAGSREQLPLLSSSHSPGLWEGWEYLPPTLSSDWGDPHLRKAQRAFPYSSITSDPQESSSGDVYRYLLSQEKFSQEWPLPHWRQVIFPLESPFFVLREAVCLYVCDFYWESYDSPCRNVMPIHGLSYQVCTHNIIFLQREHWKNLPCIAMYNNYNSVGDDIVTSSSIHFGTAVLCLFLGRK